MHQLPSITPDLLVVALNPQAKASLLDEWTWLIGTEKHPILVTACGDIFIEDLLAGAIYFLDVSSPKLSLVAETREAFEASIGEQSFIQSYLHPDRVQMLRADGLLLKKDQVYSFRIPLSMGGEFGIENIEITDVEIHFSITGQIECQIADIPAGAAITSIRIDRIPTTKRRWKFW